MKAFFLPIVIAASMFVISCDSSTNSESDEYLKVSSESVLSKKGTVSYTLTTPDARKDIHAKFVFLYAWGDVAKRKSDQTMPPLKWQLQVSPGFSYFPTEPAKMEKNTDGEYWWRVTNDIGAKNDSAASVQYEIYATMQDYASDATTVSVKGEIQYVPYGQ